MPHSVSTTAFDRLATDYDVIESRNPIFQWMRRRVQHAALAAFERGGRLLEVGCGTGTDALFFARRGHRVVALDPSAAMLEVAREKIALAGFSHIADFRQSGAEHLHEVIANYGKASFDGIFSNFGALNCVADLRQFARDTAILLRPGGKMLLNIMPPICPWEVFYYLFKLKPVEALRRWRGRNGARGLPVNLGNRQVQTYYHSAAAVAKNFLPAVEIEKQLALGLLLPPPYLSVVRRNQKIFNVLLNGEKILADWPLLRNWGDHVVFILRRKNQLAASAN